MTNLYISVFFALNLLACNSSQERSKREIIKFDIKIIDSLKRTSDTIFTEILGREDYYYCDYYLNKNDSSSARIFRDSEDNVVGYGKSMRDNVYFFAEYFPNGQIRGLFPSDRRSSVNALVKYYYEDGRIKSQGSFKNEQWFGIWKNYDEDGYLISTDEYDEKGNIIKSTKVH